MLLFDFGTRLTQHSVSSAVANFAARVWQMKKRKNTHTARSHTKKTFEQRHQRRMVELTPLCFRPFGCTSSLPSHPPTHGACLAPDLDTEEKRIEKVYSTISLFEAP